MIEYVDQTAADEFFAGNWIYEVTICVGCRVAWSFSEEWPWSYS